MKLALGTVQFGLDYGITNHDGKMTHSEALKIINTANDANISIYDTAHTYGDSETVLGKLTLKSQKIQFISKFTISPESNISIIERVLLSLRNLRSTSLYGMLFHNENDLLSRQGLNFYEELMNLKAQGRIQKIGASFYSLQALETAIEKYNLDIIQIPASCLDQRFQQSGILQEARKKNIEVHARSLFLQGLLLTPNADLPHSLLKFSPVLDFYFATAKQLNLSPLQLALAYLIKTEEINYGVVGCQSAHQLIQIVNAYNEMQEKNINIDFNSLSVTDPQLVNPTLWQ